MSHHRNGTETIAQTNFTIINRKVSESSKHSAEESFHSLNSTESLEYAMDVSVCDTADSGERETSSIPVADKVGAEILIRIFPTVCIIVGDP